MKNLGKNVLCLIIILLVIVIFVVVGVVIKNSNVINKQELNKTKQLTESTSDNAYISMETHLEEIANAAIGSKPEKIASDCKGNQTIDCSSYTGYENFTIDNFIVEFIKQPYQKGLTTSFTLSKTYDNSTGILKLKGLTCVDSSGNTTGTSYIYTNVYLVK